MKKKDSAGLGMTIVMKADLDEATEIYDRQIRKERIKHTLDLY